MWPLEVCPKYVTCFYVRDHWVVQSDSLVVHESIFAYQLVSWLLIHGYETTGTETWERRNAQRVVC